MERKDAKYGRNILMMAWLADSVACVINIARLCMMNFNQKCT